MRNIIVHQYFSIDVDEIWNTVERDLPKLKYDVLKILMEFADQ
ncbi:MAG: HepT-like ribonuclease domain-containing protein [Candidatus Poribacteria bacterium]